MKSPRSTSSGHLVGEHHLEMVVIGRKKWPSNYSIAGICFLTFVIINIGFWWLVPKFSGQVLRRDLPAELQSHETVVLGPDSPLAEPRNKNCTFHNISCLEVYHCGYDDKTTVSVYIYPIQQYYDENGNDISPVLSREFEEILRVIAESPYYTKDPETACLFVPSIDLLNQNLIKPNHVAQILAHLKWWNHGNNHLLFNMLPGAPPDYTNYLSINTGNAMVAGGGFSSITYRRSFDITIPVYNTLLEHTELTVKPYKESRKWMLLSSQMGLNAVYKSKIKTLVTQNISVVMIDQCVGRPFNYSIRCDLSGNAYTYPVVLQDSTFCLVVRGNRLGQPSLLDVLMAGCIPVVLADGYLLPFHEVLDWTRAVVHVKEEQLSEIMEILKKFSTERIFSMRRQGQLYWQKYFKSLSDITLTTLQIISGRVFPYDAVTYDEWNELPNTTSFNTTLASLAHTTVKLYNMIYKNVQLWPRPSEDKTFAQILELKKAIKNPLFLPLHVPKHLGFTAVVLTFDRIDSLFQVVRQVGKVPSLSKIIVVWNNQVVMPPPMSQWPNIGKPIKVIQTKYNRLSNRFYPYDEIETECILALDDDIVMLTPDEVEFGFEVWREHPDRLVGYPSRLHLWQNDTHSYSYESEWMNAISMVLTGAAFHHKYFSFMYTFGMPGNLKQWVDEHINCEDIAMNFLVSNVTGKAPIKVVPRKKFKCPECVKEMLSADTSHMVERSECINHFVDLYGSMPLKPVEFRADPHLYKDKLPGVLKKFNDLGTL